MNIYPSPIGKGSKAELQPYGFRTSIWDVNAADGLCGEYQTGSA
jgi:hypothetical protein